jgi:hypothetical protein
MAWRPYHRVRQIYVPNPQGICTVGLESGGGLFEIRWRVPDSRLRVKCSLIFSPEGPWNRSTFDISASADMWIYAADQMRQGGSSGLAPVNDLEELAGVPITRAAPLPIPRSAGLIGYSREFVTSADYIVARVTFNPNAELAGEWVAQGQYQPEGQRLPDAEWDEIRSQCGSIEVGPG